MGRGITQTGSVPFPHHHSHCFPPHSHLPLSILHLVSLSHSLSIHSHVIASHKGASGCGAMRWWSGLLMRVDGMSGWSCVGVIAFARFSLVCLHAVCICTMVCGGWWIVCGWSGG